MKDTVRRTRDQREEMRRRRMKRRRRKKVRICLTYSFVIFAAAYLLFTMTMEQCIAAPEQEKDGEIVEAVKIDIANAYGSRKESSKISIVDLTGYVPKAPRCMELSEALEELNKKAEEYQELQSILERVEQYPEDMLIAFCNNLEMYEFVRDYPSLNDGVSTGLTEEELAQGCPLLLQWDKRWGYTPYGNNVVGLSGCGPTCLSMAVVALTGNKDITPDVTASYSMRNGYYVEGVGTSWNLFTEGAASFGIMAEEIVLNEEVMKACIDRGCPIICSMGPGDFTTSGHFIVIYDYDENGFKINDPNCISRSRESWPYERIAGQIKILWAYSRC